MSRIAVMNGGTARHDLPAGWMDARTSQELLSRADVWMVDDFEITDLPVSTTVACTVRLTLAGSVAASNFPYHYAGGRAEAGIKLARFSDEDSVSFLADNGTPQNRVIDAVLDLPVILSAGSPFRLEFHVGVLTEVSTAGSSLRGDIQFVGLPQQAGVRSCTGFVVRPVAVKLQTWARIKELYRSAL